MDNMMGSVTFVCEEGHEVHLPKCVLMAVSPLLREMLATSQTEATIQESCDLEALRGFSAACMLFYGEGPLTFLGLQDDCRPLLPGLPLVHKYEAHPIGELYFALLCHKPHWAGICAYDELFDPVWPQRVLTWMLDRVHREDCTPHLARLRNQTLVELIKKQSQ